MIGRTISHYKIIEKIGQGGMGVVYKAKDTKLGRTVALKFLAWQAPNDEEAEKRFLREAKAAAALDHPNICTIYEVDEVDGKFFIAMAYLEGVTLDQRIAEGPLPFEEAFDVAMQIARGLVEAHSKGVHHRDIKPANLLLMEKGANERLVKIMDFGLAHFAGQSQLTREGTMMGTAGYMSPEQAQGSRADHRADIWSLGVVIYEMVAGQRPFKGDHEQVVVYSILNEDPEPLTALRAGVPIELEHVMAKALAKDANDRYQHVDELLIDLRAIGRSIGAPGAETGLGTRRFTTQYQLPPPPKGRLSKKVLMTVASVGVLVAASVGATLWFTRSPGPAAAPVLTRLTSDSGLTYQPTISPDGNLLAYSSDRGEEGNLDIWLEQIGGGQPIQLTFHEADDSEPAFSPDGTKIAFRSERGDGGVRVVPALGGETPRLIAPDGHRPRFSPDGDWISYWTGPIGNALVAGSTNTYIVPSTGGEAIQVDPEFSATRHPIWSPDGKHLLLLGRSANAENIQGVDWWLVPIDGGAPIQTGALEVFRRQRLSPPPGEYTIVPASWPSGRDTVAFGATFGDTTNVWEVTLSAQTRRVEGSALRVTSGTGLEVQPSFVSPSGGDSRLVFSDLRPNVDVWSVPIDANRGRVAGEMLPVTHNIAFDGFPTASADAKRLAFISARSGNWDVWTRDLETGEEAAATVTPFEELQPIISADGSKVFYWTRENEKRFVYQTSFRGGGPTRLCEECGTPTDVFEDYLLLESVRGPQALFIIDVASNKIASLVESTRSSQIPYAGRFSPDGRWIAFHATTERPARARQIFVVPFRGWPSDTGEPRPAWIPVTDGKAMDRQAYWSPDGNLLYFLSDDRDGFRCIWAQWLDPATKHPVGAPFTVLHCHHGRRSLRGVGSRVSAGRLTVVRDKLLFALGELRGNIWMKEVPGQL